MFYLDRLFPRRRLPDLLPWDLPIDDRTVFTRIGGLLQVAHVVPPALDALSGPALDAYYDQIAALEGRADDGWTIMHDHWRWLRDANLPAADYDGNVAAQAIDSAERREFDGETAFDNALFIPLHYEPETGAGLMDWLAGRDQAFSRSAMVRRFRDDVRTFWSELALIMPRVEVLCGAALASYLSQTVNYEATPAELPPLLISEHLATARWRAGVDPMIGRRHVRTVEVYSMGALTGETTRFLQQLPFESRIVVRIDATAKHRQRKWLEKMRAEYEQRRQSLARRMIQHFTRREEPDTNPAAAQQVAEVDQLQAEVMLGGLGFAPISMTVHVWDTDPRVAEENAFRVEVELKNRGFRAERAEISAITALLADVPGNDPQPREVPALFSQIARISPLAGSSRGEATDGKWGGPALLLGYGENDVPVRFALHGPGEGNGNTAIIGQSRGGKSVLLAKMAAAALKYPASRVILFDIGRAFMPACLCLGGDWIEIGQAESVVQPLRHVDDFTQSLLIHDWLCRCLAHQGVVCNHETEHALTAAMRLVALLPLEHRTMSALVSRIGESIAVRRALEAFTLPRGKWGQMFDGVVESYGSARVVGIEVGALRQSPILPLVVSAIFDALRYERLREGHPSMVIFDEAHELIKREAFSAEIERLAREIAKHNGVMVLATQDPADLTVELARVIEAQCMNRIVTPNPDVLDENKARFYRELGYSDEELAQIAQAYRRAEYFVRCPSYRARLRIRLTGEAAAICCHTTPRDIQLCRQLLAEGVAPGPDFTSRWLEQHRADAAPEREEAA
jgi:type IV secretion system protein VirB4